MSKNYLKVYDHDDYKLSVRNQGVNRVHWRLYYKGTEVEMGVSNTGHRGGLLAGADAIRKHRDALKEFLR